MSDAKLPRIEYRPSELAKCYRGARMLELESATGSQLVPYTLEFSYAKARTQLYMEEGWGFATVLDKTYRFPAELTRYRDSIYAAYPSQIARKDDHAAVCPRVYSFNVGEAGSPHWDIGFARYSDQVGSNMYPDEPFDPPIVVAGVAAKNVREWDQLAAGLPGQLPPFELSRLANTIGVAIGITARDEFDREMVLWRRRSKKVRVFAGMPALPLSFALNLDHRDWVGSQSIRELVFSDQNAERAEEVGIEEHHFLRLKPLAFCRELPRAGKPQFFLEKRSTLSLPELKEAIIDSVEFERGLEGFPLWDPPPQDASPELLAFVALKRMESAAESAS